MFFRGAIPGRLLRDHDLVIRESDLGTGERYVTDAVGRLHFADRQGAFVVYATNVESFSVLGLTTRNRLGRNVVPTGWQPDGVATAEDLKRETVLLFLRYKV